MQAALRCSRPWRATIATGLALALLIPFSARAQISDEMRIGSWRLIPYEGLGPGSCLLLTHSPDKDALIAFVDDEEETQFGFLSFTKDLSGPNRAAMDMRLDGKVAPISSIRPFDESLVLFRQPADAERLDDLLIIADKVEVRGRDFVAEFKPYRTLAALLELWQCNNLRGEPHGDIDALEAEIRARSKQAGAIGSAGAGANEMVGAGSTPSADSRSSNELDAAIDGMSAAGAMVAQFACELSGPALTGIPDILNKNQMTEMMLSISEDGSATINGTQVAAASVRRGGDGSLLMAAYDGRMVVSAVHGTPGSAAPVWGLSDEQVEAYQFGQQFGLNMLGKAMADRNRFMLANLDQDTITFFDLDANNQATNQQTPLCIRTR